MNLLTESASVDLIASMGADTYALQDLVSAHLLVNFNKLTVKSVLRAPEYLRKVMRKSQITTLVVS